MIYSPPAFKILVGRVEHLLGSPGLVRSQEGVLRWKHDLMYGLQSIVLLCVSDLVQGLWDVCTLCTIQSIVFVISRAPESDLVGVCSCMNALFTVES
jgi:hypothetical protein